MTFHGLGITNDTADDDDDDLYIRFLDVELSIRYFFDGVLLLDEDSVVEFVFVLVVVVVVVVLETWLDTDVDTTGCTSWS